MKFLSILLSLLLFIAYVAQAQEIPNQTNLPESTISTEMIEVGTGTIINNTRTEVLLEVRTNIIKRTTDQVFYVLARIDANMSAGNEISYLDISFESLGYGVGDKENYIEAALLNLNIQRNLMINNLAQTRISFLGIRGALDTPISNDLDLLVKGAVDLFGVAYSKRASDGLSSTGSTSGIELEAGVRIKDKFRITFKAKSNSVTSKGDTYYNGYYCAQYYEPGYYDPDGYYYPGYYHTQCYDSYSTYFHDKRIMNDLSLNFNYRVNSKINIFSKIGYSVYKVIDETDPTSNIRSKNSSYQFLFGASYRFVK